MTREEFDEVLILTDISNPTSEKKSAYGTLESMHYWQYLTIYFNGKNTAIINGKIPLEVATAIYNNYDRFKYRIYFDKTNIASTLDEQVVDDIFFERLNAYIRKNPEESVTGLMNKAKTERKAMMKRKTPKYIKNYYIETKEGLFILINEMKKYLIKNHNGDKHDIKYYDDEIKSYISSFQRTNNKNN